MKLEEIIALANQKVRSRFFARERSLRAVGCDLPFWSFPMTKLVLTSHQCGKLGHTKRFKVADPMSDVRLKRILELDGLRAFAVIAVVIYHMAYFAGSLPIVPYWLGNVGRCFGIGVSIFFVISGFIITKLLIHEKMTVGRVSLTAFYIRRFFRIVPPLATYLFALLVIGAFGWIATSPRSLLGSALFLVNLGFLDSFNYYFVAHTWTLSVEEQFYLLFPPLLCIVFSFRARPTLGALCIAYVLSLTSLKLAHELSRFNSNWLGVSGLYNFRYIIVGVLLALYSGEGRLRFLTDKPRILPLAVVVMMIFMPVFETSSHLLSLLIATLHPCICGLFVMWVVENPSRCRILRWRAVQWIGACSYSIYLWQQLFTGSASLYHGWSLAQSPLAAVAIISCAALSHYLIERPSIRLGRFISRRFLIL